VTIKGKVETLPDRVQEALKKGFEDDLWTEADVPDEGTTLEVTLEEVHGHACPSRSVRSCARG
jgi:hypothetical protein